MTGGAPVLACEEADWQVMIGIHGNGLTHELWMSHDSMLIEVSCINTHI